MGTHIKDEADNPIEVSVKTEPKFSIAPEGEHTSITEFAIPGPKGEIGATGPQGTTGPTGPQADPLIEQFVDITLDPTTLTSAPFYDPTQSGPGLVIVSAPGIGKAIVVNAIAIV